MPTTTDLLHASDHGPNDHLIGLVLHFSYLSRSQNCQSSLQIRSAPDEDRALRESPVDRLLKPVLVLRWQLNGMDLTSRFHFLCRVLCLKGGTKRASGNEALTCGDKPLSERQLCMALCICMSKLWNNTMSSWPLLMALPPWELEGSIDEFLTVFLFPNSLLTY